MQYTGFEPTPSGWRPDMLEFAINTNTAFIERVIGIEPTSSAWKADALTVVLYPHGQVPGFAPTFYNLIII